MPKTVLISGGTSGVGKAIAKSFVQHGDHVTLIGRNEQHAQQAIADLQLIAGHGSVDYLLGDLADPDQNQRVATAFAAQHDHLDVLVNSADNIATNSQSHYWLTQHLVTCLAASTDARVFLITGFPAAIVYGPILESQLGLAGRGLWLLTHKTLLMVLLAAELQAHRIAVNAFFPGVIQSNLYAGSHYVKNQDVTALYPVASDPGLLGVTGQFFDNHGKNVPLSARKYNPQRAAAALK